MPIYDYYCENCQSRFETYHSKPDDEKEECPLCSSLSNRVFQEEVHYKKTHFVAPPLAKRKFGEKNRTPHKSPRWV